MNDMLADGMLGGGAAASAESLYDKTTSKDSCCPSLSARVRFIGFILCFFVGMFDISGFHHECSFLFLQV